jgi:hypothetical protein
MIDLLKEYLRRYFVILFWLCAFVASVLGLGALMIWATKTGGPLLVGVVIILLIPAVFAIIPFEKDDVL